MFSTFNECSQMTGVFYHSVIHGLGFFICFKISILNAQNNKTGFFHVLYSDKTWVFDQSECTQGSIYILVYTSFAPWRVCPHELILNFLFRVRQSPSMDQRTRNKHVLFHSAYNIVFFFSV